MADLPGLIEGAHAGVGLGHQFLRHIERTRVIVHVIDMSGLEGRDPYEDYVTINNELKEYNLRLTERPQVVVANKMDMPDAEENLQAFKEKVGDEVKIFPISAVTRQGVRDLLFEVANLIETTPEFPIHEVADESDTSVMYKFDTEGVKFEITRESDGTFVISGYDIEKTFKMTDFSRDESIRRFARQMRGMGIDEALRARGAKDGDIVKFLNMNLNLSIKTAEIRQSFYIVKSDLYRKKSPLIKFSIYNKRSGFRRIFYGEKMNMYKILIVEDDEKIAGILEEHLERYGYQSFRASDLRQIKDEFVKVNPHLVLLDINLPYFDGFIGVVKFVLYRMHQLFLFLQEQEKWIK